MSKKIHDIVNEVAGRNSKYTRSEIETITKDFIQVITETLTSGEEVLIHDFGKFTITQYEARTVKNPFGEGVDYDIPARRSITFKDSKHLKQVMNREYDVPKYQS